MNIKYVRAESIKSIVFRGSKPLNLTWHEATPEITKFFGLILKKSAVKAGWAEKDDYYKSSTEDLIENGDKNFDSNKPNGKQWSTKPSIGIYYKNQGYDRTYYNTDEEAMHELTNLVRNNPDLPKVKFKTN
jgi:hypothetical protein